MNWEAVGAIADLVGAAGVVVTLVYLAAQIRQNTISTRTSSYQAVVEALSDWSRSAGLDPTVAKLLAEGQRHLDALSPEQRAQFVLLQVSLFRNYENIFYQHEQRAIDDVATARCMPGGPAPTKFLEENPFEPTGADSPALTSGSA